MTVADKRCENGHFIDESWDLCPYCPSENAADMPMLSSARVSTSSDQVVRLSTQARPSPATELNRPVPTRTVTQPRDTPVAEVPPMERTFAVQKAAAQSAETKRYVVGWLVCVSGPARGESYPIRIGRNVMGRDRRSDIPVNDEQASAHHADLMFRPEEKRFILMDHNSTNGTFVNEVEIEPRRDLAEKDVIRIGAHKFLFVPLCRQGFYWDDEGPLQ